MKNENYVQIVYFQNENDMECKAIIFGGTWIANLKFSSDSFQVCTVILHKISQRLT